MDEDDGVRPRRLVLELEPDADEAGLQQLLTMVHGVARVEREVDWGPLLVQLERLVTGLDELRDVLAAIADEARRVTGAP